MLSSEALSFEHEVDIFPFSFHNPNPKLFTRLITALIRLFPSVKWRIPTAEKVLFLTFDDGPAPEVTPDVLDLLKKYKAKGTFFCVGENIRRHPELANRISSEGHVIGNHSFNHINGWKFSMKDYLDDVKQCTDLIREKKIQVKEPMLFRPPYGKLSWSQFLSLKKSYEIIMWDVLSRDWEPNRSAESCFERVARKAGRGSIVVFHDSIKARHRMLPALQQTLEYFTAQGFGFKSLAGDN